MTFVDRPTRRRLLSQEQYAQLDETLENGKSIVIKLNGTDPKSLRSALYQRYRRRDMKAHVHVQDAGYVLAWLSRRG